MQYSLRELYKPDCTLFQTTQWDNQEVFLLAVLEASLNREIVVSFTNISSGTQDLWPSALSAYQTSRQRSNVIIESLKGFDVFDPTQHLIENNMLKSRNWLKHPNLKVFWWSSQLRNRGLLKELCMAKTWHC